MRLLLDTNAFIWALDDIAKLSPGARDMLAAEENELFVSIASLWEIAIKVAIGKLNSGLDWESYLPRMGASLLPIEISHAREVSRLPLLHRDPFDRMLIAQAKTENMILVSRDSIFTDYDITVLPA